MNWHWPLGVLVCLLFIGALTTFFNINRAATDTLTVELGIRASGSPKTQHIDQAAVTAYERRQFNKELKQRLNKPPRTVNLSGFYVDACEVSQREWEQFVEWQLAQPNFDQTAINSWLKSESSDHRIAGRLTSPASGINYKGASAYCTAANGRLPFAEEFEVMASGADANIYPWGNEFNSDAWQFNSAARNAAQSCGIFPSTSTPSGIHDLATNVMEWGQGMMYAETIPFQPSIHGAPATRRSHRELYALNAAWLLGDTNLKSHYVGFRCAYGRHPLILPWRRKVQDVVSIPRGDYDIGLPAEARMPLFLANMPAVRDLHLLELVHEDEANKLTVDRCEVNRGAYAMFLNDPLVKLGMFSNENQPAAIDYIPLEWDSQLEDESLPVAGINWWAADAYARWAGGRLPTVEEWRLLAAGSAGGIYPWGMAYEKEAATTGDDATSKLSECGASHQDTTNDGVYDLGGNLSEWTRSLSASNSRLSIWVQGGNWLLPGLETSKSLFGRTVPMAFQSESIGFRVVYD